MGLNGRLPLFIDNFSEGGKSPLGQHPLFTKSTGGGWPTRWYYFTNSIYALPEDIEKSFYVDDLAVYCQSSNMAIFERRLQGCLDKLVTYAEENGFKFSPTKTLCTFL